MASPTKIKPSEHKDASLNTDLNPVTLRTGQVVAWAIAFPRP